MPAELARPPAPYTVHAFSVVVAVDKKKRQEARELAAAVQLLVRPGGHVSYAALTRVLRTLGYNPTRRELLLAVLEHQRDAYSAQLGTHGKPRPRCIVGVRLCVDHQKVADAVRAQWERQLEAERLGAEIQVIASEYTCPSATPGSRLDVLVQRVRQRKDDADRYYSLCCEYLHRNGWNRFPPGNKRVWQLHCEGATLDDIVAATKLSRAVVRAILDRHRARCGIVR